MQGEKFFSLPISLKLFYLDLLLSFLITSGITFLIRLKSNKSISPKNFLFLFLTVLSFLFYKQTF